VADVLESDPGLFMFMMMMLVSFGIAFTFGILLCALFIAIASILIGCGVVSLSVMIGLYSRSLSTGVRWFTKLSFLALSFAAAYATIFFLQVIGWLPIAVLPAFGLASLGAFAAGLLFDLIFHKVLSVLYNLLRSKTASAS
jgi:hypothetical protein